MKEKTVSAWMHRGVISCRPDTSVEKVAQVMDAEDVSALVVVNDAGEAVGLISRTDLVNVLFVRPYLKHWRGMTAEHLMSGPVVGVTPETPLKEAIRLLQGRQIHRLVVVDSKGVRNQPVGILSATDVARHIAEEKG